MSSSDASGQFDIGALLEQAQAMQRHLVEAQEVAAEQVVEGQSGGGAVRVRVTGGLVFQSASITPSALDPTDPGMLEDLVVAACNDAVAKAQDLNQQALGVLDPGSFGLPGLSPRPAAGPAPTPDPGPAIADEGD